MKVLDLKWHLHLGGAMVSEKIWIPAGTSLRVVFMFSSCFLHQKRLNDISELHQGVHWVCGALQLADLSRVYPTYAQQWLGWFQQPQDTESKWMDRWICLQNQSPDLLPEKRILELILESALRPSPSPLWSRLIKKDVHVFVIRV